MKTVVCIATVAGRESQLKRAVESLVGQADQVCVAFNGYSTVPHAFAHLVTRVFTPNVGAGAKFAWASDYPDRVHLTCDDDIIYPPDYVESMATFAEKLGVVGVHGVTVDRAAVRVRGYRHSLWITHFADRLAAVKRVHMVGTGTLAYLPSAVTVDTEALLRHRNAADLAFAQQCIEQSAPLYAVPRRVGWLSAQRVPPRETIWGASNQGTGSAFDARATADRLARAIPWPEL